MVAATSSTKNISVTLKVWRQADARAQGKFVEYKASDLNPNMSFLEMLDVVNDKLESQGEEPIAFAHDCREGICGTCSLVIDDKPHGPHGGIASCQTYMRSFKDGDVIVVEPYRAKPFPVQKDLITDRSSFDKIQQAGGFISVRTGSACDANATPIPKENADLAMDAAACIGCGACVAACKMVSKMDELGFGNCTNQYECTAACPKTISHDFIARMNADYLKASFRAAFKAKSSM